MKSIWKALGMGPNPPPASTSATSASSPTAATGGAGASASTTSHHGMSILPDLQESENGSQRVQFGEATHPPLSSRRGSSKKGANTASSQTPKSLKPSPSSGKSSPALTSHFSFSSSVSDDALFEQGAGIQYWRQVDEKLPLFYATELQRRMELFRIEVKQQMAAATDDDAEKVVALRENFVPSLRSMFEFIDSNVIATSSVLLSSSESASSSGATVSSIPSSPKREIEKTVLVNLRLGSIETDTEKEIQMLIALEDGIERLGSGDLLAQSGIVSLFLDIVELLSDILSVGNLPSDCSAFMDPGMNAIVKFTAKIFSLEKACIALLALPAATVQSSNNSSSTNLAKSPDLGDFERLFRIVGNPACSDATRDVASRIIRAICIGQLHPALEDAIVEKTLVGRYLQKLGILSVTEQKNVNKSCPRTVQGLLALVELLRASCRRSPCPLIDEFLEVKGYRFLHHLICKFTQSAPELLDIVCSLVALGEGFGAAEEEGNRTGDTQLQSEARNVPAFAVISHLLAELCAPIVAQQEDFIKKLPDPCIIKPMATHDDDSTLSHDISSEVGALRGGSMDLPASKTATSNGSSATQPPPALTIKLSSLAAAPVAEGDELRSVEDELHSRSSTLSAYRIQSRAQSMSSPTPEILLRRETRSLSRAGLGSSSGPKPSPAVFVNRSRLSSWASINEHVGHRKTLTHVPEVDGELHSVASSGSAKIFTDIAPLEEDIAAIADPTEYREFSSSLSAETFSMPVQKSQKREFNEEELRLPLLHSVLTVYSSSPKNFHILDAQFGVMSTLLCCLGSPRSLHDQFTMMVIKLLELVILVSDTHPLNLIGILCTVTLPMISERSAPYEPYVSPHAGDRAFDESGRDEQSLSEFSLDPYVVVTNHLCDTLMTFIQQDPSFRDALWTCGIFSDYLLPVLHKMTKPEDGKSSILLFATVPKICNLLCELVLRHPENQAFYRNAQITPLLFRIMLASTQISGAHTLSAQEERVFEEAAVAILSVPIQMTSDECQGISLDVGHLLELVQGPFVSRLIAFRFKAVILDTLSAMVQCNPAVVKDLWRTMGGFEAILAVLLSLDKFFLPHSSKTDSEDGAAFGLIRSVFLLLASSLADGHVENRLYLKEELTYQVLASSFALTGLLESSRASDFVELVLDFATEAYDYGLSHDMPQQRNMLRLRNPLALTLVFMELASLSRDGVETLFSHLNELIDGSHEEASWNKSILFDDGIAESILETLSHSFLVHIYGKQQIVFADYDNEEEDTSGHAYQGNRFDLNEQDEDEAGEDDNESKDDDSTPSSSAAAMVSPRSDIEGQSPRVAAADKTYSSPSPTVLRFLGSLAGYRPTTQFLVRLLQSFSKARMSGKVRKSQEDTFYIQLLLALGAGGCASGGNPSYVDMAGLPLPPSQLLHPPRLHHRSTSNSVSPSARKSLGSGKPANFFFTAELQRKSIKEQHCGRGFVQIDGLGKRQWPPQAGYSVSMWFWLGDNNSETGEVFRADSYRGEIMLLALHAPNPAAESSGGGQSSLCVLRLCIDLVDVNSGSNDEPPRTPVHSSGTREVRLVARTLGANGKRHVTVLPSYPFLERKWHHLLVVHKPEKSYSFLMDKSGVTGKLYYYLDGAKFEPVPFPYPTPLPNGGSNMQGFIGADMESPPLIRKGPMPWRMGPALLCEGAVTAETAPALYLLGPSYGGVMSRSNTTHRDLKAVSAAISERVISLVKSRREGAAAAAAANKDDDELMKHFTDTGLPNNNWRELYRKLNAILAARIGQECLVFHMNAENRADAATRMQMFSGCETLYGNPWSPYPLGFVLGGAHPMCFGSLGSVIASVGGAVVFFPLLESLANDGRAVDCGNVVEIIRRSLCGSDSAKVGFRRDNGHRVLTWLVHLVVSSIMPTTASTSPISTTAAPINSAVSRVISRGEHSSSVATELEADVEEESGLNEDDLESNTSSEEESIFHEKDDSMRILESVMQFSALQGCITDPEILGFILMNHHVWRSPSTLSWINMSRIFRWLLGLIRSTNPCSALNHSFFSDKSLGALQWILHVCLLVSVGTAESNSRNSSERIARLKVLDTAMAILETSLRIEVSSEILGLIFNMIIGTLQNHSGKTLVDSIRNLPCSASVFSFANRTATDHSYSPYLVDLRCHLLRLLLSFIQGPKSGDAELDAKEDRFRQAMRTKYIEILSKDWFITVMGEDEITSRLAFLLLDDLVKHNRQFGKSFLGNPASVTALSTSLAPLANLESIYVGLFRIILNLPQPQVYGLAESLLLDRDFGGAEKLHDLLPSMSSVDKHSLPSWASAALSGVMYLLPLNLHFGDSGRLTNFAITSFLSKAAEANAEIHRLLTMPTFAQLAIGVIFSEFNVLLDHPDEVFGNSLRNCDDDDDDANEAAAAAAVASLNLDESNTQFVVEEVHSVVSSGQDNTSLLSIVRSAMPEIQLKKPEITESTDDIQQRASGSSESELAPTQAIATSVSGISAISYNSPTWRNIMQLLVNLLRLGLRTIQTTPVFFNTLCESCPLDASEECVDAFQTALHWLLEDAIRPLIATPSYWKKHILPGGVQSVSVGNLMVAMTKRGIGPWIVGNEDVLIDSACHTYRCTRIARLHGLSATLLALTRGLVLRSLERCVNRAETSTKKSDIVSLLHVVEWHLPVLLSSEEEPAKDTSQSPTSTFGVLLSSPRRNSTATPPRPSPTLRALPPHMAASAAAAAGGTSTTARPKSLSISTASTAFSGGAATSSTLGMSGSSSMVLPSDAGDWLVFLVCLTKPLFELLVVEQNRIRLSASGLWLTLMELKPDTLRDVLVPQSDSSLNSKELQAQQELALEIREGFAKLLSARAELDASASVTISADVEAQVWADAWSDDEKEGNKVETDDEPEVDMSKAEDSNLTRKDSDHNVIVTDLSAVPDDYKYDEEEEKNKTTAILLNRFVLWIRERQQVVRTVVASNTQAIWVREVERSSRFSTSSSSGTAISNQQLSANAVRQARTRSSSLSLWDSGAETITPPSLSLSASQLNLAPNAPSIQEKLKVVAKAIQSLGEGVAQMERSKLEELLRGRRSWQELRLQLASTRWAFFVEQRPPNRRSTRLFWKLDVVEGPLRARRRLERNFEFENIHGKIRRDSLKAIHQHHQHGSGMDSSTTAPSLNEALSALMRNVTVTTDARIGDDVIDDTELLDDDLIATNAAGVVSVVTTQQRNSGDDISANPKQEDMIDDLIQ